jgi:hypothetical protein
MLVISVRAKRSIKTTNLFYEYRNCEELLESVVKVKTKEVTNPSTDIFFSVIIK